jgi:hypothetical protein
MCPIRIRGTIIPTFSSASFLNTNLIILCPSLNESNNSPVPLLQEGSDRDREDTKAFGKQVY